MDFNEFAMKYYEEKGVFPTIDEYREWLKREKVEKKEAEKGRGKRAGRKKRK